MKVFISKPGRSIDVQIEMKNPELPPFLAANREGIRDDFAEMWEKMLKTNNLSVRFEDECEVCSKKLEPGVSDTPRCRNIECPNGVPCIDELRDLMRKHPAKKDELALAWFDRLAKAWKDEHKAKQKAQKYEPPKKVDPKLPHKALKNLKGRIK